MNMRIGLCDDNKADLEAMHVMICRMAPDHVLDSYSDSMILLSAIKSGIRYDLLFLDILMPGLSGMELAWEIRRISPDTSIVFLTDSVDFAVEAFSVKALH
jgi:DNA-binding LytR/AlgR family response regulator